LQLTEAASLASCSGFLFWLSIVSLAPSSVIVLFWLSFSVLTGDGFREISTAGGDKSLDTSEALEKC
jgi:hypothetical protein